MIGYGMILVCFFWTSLNFLCNMTVFSLQKQHGLSTQNINILTHCNVGDSTAMYHVCYWANCIIKPINNVVESNIAYNNICTYTTIACMHLYVHMCQICILTQKMYTHHTTVCNQYSGWLSNVITRFVYSDDIICFSTSIYYMLVIIDSLNQY